MVLVELGVALGLLRLLVVLAVDVVQQEVAVGYDVAHVFCLLGITELKAVNNLLGAALDGFHILRVLAVSLQGHLSLAVGCEQQRKGGA